MSSLHCHDFFLQIKSHIFLLVTADQLLQTLTKLSIDLPSIAFSISFFFLFLLVKAELTVTFHLGT